MATDESGVMNESEDTEPSSSREVAAAAKQVLTPVVHFTVAERSARGKAARAEVPRSSHAEWEPAPHRTDPIELLEDQASTRVPELVPIRYGRMLVSPFAFFRGGAYLMASDLAGTPRTGLHTQLCGDAHLSNFGAFLAPDRRLVFSVNDFDETLPGPFEWDVKRFAASLAVAGRDRGLDEQEREAVCLAGTRSYREAMRSFAQMRTLDLWYARLDIEQLAERWSAQASPKMLKQFERNVAKARTRDSLRAFDKLVKVVDGRARIVGDPPLITPVEDVAAGLGATDIEEGMRTILRSYRRTLSGDRRRLLERFNYAHAARKVVGVGSVGTRAWIVLMLGHDEGDPLFLQAKEAEASVLEPFLGKSEYSSHGQRVVEGQRLMQGATDIMLGWIRTTLTADGVERDFYIRQLWDGKGSAPIEVMDLQWMKTYAEICGWTLAKAHARSGDSVAIASYLGAKGTFDRAMVRFAELYADQNERDYQALVAAVQSGRVKAKEGL